jgi:hypothetical protein
MRVIIKTYVGEPTEFFRLILWVAQNSCREAHNSPVCMHRRVTDNCEKRCRICQKQAQNSLFFCNEFGTQRYRITVQGTGKPFHMSNRVFNFFFPKQHSKQHSTTSKATFFVAILPYHRIDVLCHFFGDRINQLAIRPESQA